MKFDIRAFYKNAQSAAKEKTIQEKRVILTHIVNMFNYFDYLQCIEPLIPKSSNYQFRDAFSDAAAFTAKPFIGPTYWSDQLVESRYKEAKAAVKKDFGLLTGTDKEVQLVENMKRLFD